MTQSITTMIHQGAHRGGSAIAANLPRVRRVQIVDPDEPNAEALERYYRALGSEVEVLHARAEDVIDALDGDRVALAPDSLPAIEHIIDRQAGGRHIEAQGMATVNGGNLPAGFQWSVPQDRPDLREDALRLIRPLRAMSRESASSAVRVDSLAAHRMNEVRRKTSALSALRLAERTRSDNLEDAATLFLPTGSYPMVVRESGEAAPTRRIDEATHLADSGPRAIALLRPGLIDIVVIEHTRSGARVPVAILTFKAPPVAPDRTERVRVWVAPPRISLPVAFTD